MLKKEYTQGDKAEDLRVNQQQDRSNALLKLLVTVYDQKNLGQKLNSEDTGLNTGIIREKINRWKKDPIRYPILIEEHTMSQIRDTLLPVKPSHWDAPDFEFIDLFAGIGGLRKGFEEVGGKCVYTNEWDDQARRTYLANHYVDETKLPYFLSSPEENPLRNTSHMDITNVTLSSTPNATFEDVEKSINFHIPDHDVLLAGFPCQPFSIAGVSKKNSLGRAHGFDCDTQGTLFFDVELIIQHKRPKFFVLENVKNLKSHDKGNTFATIIRTLDKQGYHILNVSDEGSNIEESIQLVRKRRNEPTIIDGAHFTPQHRERIVIVGIRKDLLNIDQQLKQLSLTDIPKPKQCYSVKDILCSLDTDEKQKYTLTHNLWNYLYHYALKHQTKGNGFGFGLVDPENQKAVTRTLSARYYKDGSEILINQDNLEPEYLLRNREHGIRKNQERAESALSYATDKAKDKEYSELEFKSWLKEGEQNYDEICGRYAPEFNASYKTPRRLTPRECARLMGFEKPEIGSEQFRIVCTDTRAYKQFGNSVVVPVFSAIAKLLAPKIQKFASKRKQSIAA
ncbi:cytosine methyltransferase [Vibrio xuii]|nr:cytosine methyltransferase [Vibrio xuii]